ncbi:Uncharacterised protein [Salmonella enterica subsp. enterica serovar Bovismorbificans]|nr:Uncharacterised protein [Salmonella enterica subsp. enterica serovar Bovismorbificans]CQB62541.1 Uncharacterised protein [Salmonella enterica subsp. enterica serovar Bovismorbificans]
MKTKIIFFIFAKRRPVFTRNFKKYIGADDIGFNKCCRPGNRTVHMTFRSQMHHRVRLVLLKNTRYFSGITNIRVFKIVAITFRNIRKGFKITGVG